MQMFYKLIHQKQRFPRFLTENSLYLLTNVHVSAPPPLLFKLFFTTRKCNQ